MSLRPRYSLLTLLVLTALVAGGLKLWYGPHRVRVGETLTAFEQALLKQGQEIGFTTDEWQYEYDYLQGWSERRVKSVTCFPTTNYFMVAMNFGPLVKYSPGRRYLFSEANYQIILNDSSLAAPSKDRVHCWIQPGELSEYKFVAKHPTTQRELDQGEVLLHSYIVTEKGKVYELSDTHLGIQYTKIPIDKVANFDVRARLEEELQKLPGTP